jgi:hypothetical protein
MFGKRSKMEVKPKGSSRVDSAYSSSGGGEGGGGGDGREPGGSMMDAQLVREMRGMGCTFSLEELLGLSLGVSSVPFGEPSSENTWPPYYNPFSMQGLGDGAPDISLSLPSYPEPAYSAPTADSVREHRAGMGVLVPSKIFGQIILKRSRPEDSGSGSGLVTIPPVPTPHTLFLDFTLGHSLLYKVGAFQEILMGALSQTSLDKEVVKKMVGDAGKPRPFSYTSAAQYYAASEAVKHGPAPPAAVGKERQYGWGIGRLGDWEMSSEQLIAALQRVRMGLLLKEGVGGQHFGGVAKGADSRKPPHGEEKLFGNTRVAATTVSLGNLLHILDTPTASNTSSAIVCSNISPVCYSFKDSPAFTLTYDEKTKVMSPTLCTAVRAQAHQLCTSVTSFVSCGTPASSAQAMALSFLSRVRAPSLEIPVRLPTVGGYKDTSVNIGLYSPTDGKGTILLGSLYHPSAWTGEQRISVPAVMAVAGVWSGVQLEESSFKAMTVKGALCSGHFNHTPKHQSEAGEFSTTPSPTYPTHPHPHPQLPPFLAHPRQHPQTLLLAPPLMYDTPHARHLLSPLFH